VTKVDHLYSQTSPRAIEENPSSYGLNLELQRIDANELVKHKNPCCDEVARQMYKWIIKQIKEFKKSGFLQFQE